jgi:hypothetical protein
MTTSPDLYVFNWHAILLGGFTLLICLSVQACFVTLVMVLAKSRIIRLIRQKSFRRAHAVFYLGILMLLASHLLQIYIWGMSLKWSGIMPNGHMAVMLAGSSYTTVGFISDALPVEWQLLIVIMATSGVFAFGWSTSIMFSLSRFVYPMTD